MTGIKLYFTLLLIGFVSLAYTQNLYGEKPEVCKQKVSFMTTYYKQKAYKDALPSWRYVFSNCPQASKNTYIIGSKIMESLIKETSDKQLKKQYVDTLLLIQDLRIKYFPKNKTNKTLAKKATYLLKYRLKTEYQTAYTLFDSAFSNGANELSAYDFKMYMYCYNLMVKSKKIECGAMLQAYLKINSIINDRENKGKKIKAKSKQKITEYAEICMDCNLLDSLYFKNFEQYKNDSTWLDEGISLFTVKKCNSSKTFLLLLETRFTTKPNSNTAITLGKYYFSKQNYDKTQFYFSQAITLETDSAKKAEHHVNKTKYFIAIKKYNKAILQAKKAIALDPTNASAFLLHGDAIAYSSTSYKNLTFGGKELYWLATDYYAKALVLSIDDKTKSKAINSIAKYKQYYPEKGDLFLKSLSEGDSYKVTYVVTESTKVRGRK